LNDERDITLKGLEAARASDAVLAEFYTAVLNGTTVEKLEASIGKPITVLDREAVESGETILERAERESVALLVAGDPMTATTHVDLALRAERKGIVVRIIHGVSIFSAAPGLLGLQHYTFGKTTTLAYPDEGYFPTSPLDVIASNRAAGLHTLVLLDIKADRGRFMTANEGLRLLLDMEEKVGKGVVSGDTLAGVVARAGSDDVLAVTGTVKGLLDVDFGPPLHCLVVPGEMHFMEEEAFEAKRLKP